ncbi:hypothetical protein DFH06DRAFT_293733 [Mycena polygramma]|nr:hypothetical protein DFH06DRAFT_293733 [Mycena polygramma]
MSEVATLMLRAIPYLEWSRDSPLYRPSSIHNGLKEFGAVVKYDSLGLEMNWRERAATMPMFMEMAETLHRSTAGYRRRKVQVEESNRSLLTALARENKVTFAQLVTSPTLIRHANAFAEDLTCMTHNAWGTINLQCLQEIEWLRSPGSTILCQLCRGRKQRYGWDGLQEHVRIIHPESYIAISQEHHQCTLCSRSTLFRRLKDVERHVNTMHLKTRTDL